MDTYKCQSGVMRRCGVYLADNCDGTYKGDDCECAADNQAFMPPTERDELQAYRALGTVEELSALVKARDEGPCGLCRYNPPSSCDGKPCTMCPAEAAIGKGGPHEANSI